MSLSPQFADALNFAAVLHATQYRKGAKIPYVSHLLAVTSLVLEYGGSETQAIAAMLHDAVEDQGGEPTARLIRERYGDHVTELVLACTDTDESPKPPWKARKVAYIEHLQHAPDEALLIIGADKLHNARAVLQDYRRYGPTIWARFGGGRDGMCWYLRAVTAAMAPRLLPTLLAELEETIDDLARLIQEQEGVTV